MYKTDNIERQYKDSLKELLTLGRSVDDRTGTGTVMYPHQYFYIKDCTDQFPMLRGKKVYPYMAYKELLWMLKGRTDVKWLRDHKVTYWDEWELPDGTIGKSYGYQYRNFNGVDQLQNLVNDLLNDPMSRRMIISLWNVSDMKDMALPPCQFLYQFTCVPHEESSPSQLGYYVDLHAIQRSGDSFLGVPYNFMFSSLFLAVICDYCSKATVNCKGKDAVYIPRDIHHTVNHYHLYNNHRLQAEEYIKNVEENLNGVIDDKTKININTPGSITLSWENIDEYLNFLMEDPMRTLSVKSNKHDEYGTIKADISV